MTKKYEDIDFDLMIKQSMMRQKSTKVEDVYVTDAAIVAYFRNILKYDIEKIKDTIFPMKFDAKHQYINDCWYVIDGFKVLVKDGLIVYVDVNAPEDF